MMLSGAPRTWHSRLTLATDLRGIGLRPGDTVMAHGAMRAVGPIQGGVDALVDAILDVVGPDGTLMAYTDWNADHLALADETGAVPQENRPHVAAFDPRRSRASRDNGILPEWVRSHPDARRSENPGASVAAIGARAEALTKDHGLDYGYGEDTPLARLVELDGKVLMVGAPWDTMTLLHHCEHLAKLPDKRVIRSVVPIARGGVTEWQPFEEFDTEVPVVAGLDDDYFAAIVQDFVDEHGVEVMRIGDATSLLVPAREMAAFGVAWLEDRQRG